MRALLRAGARHLFEHLLEMLLDHLNERLRPVAKAARIES